MLTDRQQQQVTELAESFEEINAIGYAPHDVFAMIDKAQSNMRYRKGAEAAMKAAAYGAAKEAMEKWAREVVRPVCRKYFGDEKKVTINDNGSLFINSGRGYDNLVINAVHHAPFLDGYTQYTFVGFKLDNAYSGVTEIKGTDLSVFNGRLADFVIKNAPL